MLVVRDLTRRFGPRRALDGVSLQLEPGTLTALTGPNGAGKSTLLRIAATLESPTTGRVEVAGVDVRRDGAAARRHVAWLGQEPGLYPELSVRENLAFTARFFGRASDVARACDATGIRHRIDARAGELSRGERQRAALARAVLAGPLMLLDEPTTALDSEGAQAAVELLVSLRGERTLLVATHDARLIAAADRVVRLDAGRVALEAAA